MKFLSFTFLLFFTLLFSCNTHILKSSTNNELVENEVYSLVHSRELKIFKRFDTPPNFRRNQHNTEFGKWLNNLSLKSHTTPVYTFDGQKKSNPNIYVGVLDLDQPKKNVQFNANAVISLRLEYFYREKKYSELDKLAKISTKPTPYTKFVKGDYSYSKYIEYLQYYLENTNSHTITELLKAIPLKELQIGDVFFQKGSIKSHAVIVMDLAQDEMGNKIYILAQSYYPSQNIQILTNPSNDLISPWYIAKDGVLLTPEWRFLSSDLMRFK
ncbi:hypothetical protein F0358_09775 [Empedobacter brevis]|uniref:DUF4846 domain-containing protein n=1 Tax=Empedobacter brevis TaxID=247 RepID=UPI00123E0903|nr:DUF4846 domain-containing protein [Empedobacter brevis]QES92978.1 hypothetical protein F0358_09775 [Empedobacter brevis]